MLNRTLSIAIDSASFGAYFTGVDFVLGVCHQ